MFIYEASRIRLDAQRLRDASCGRVRGLPKRVESFFIFRCGSLWMQIAFHGDCLCNNHQPQCNNAFLAFWSIWSLFPGNIFTATRLGSIPLEYVTHML